MSFCGKNFFNPLYMYIRVFPAGTVAQVDAELKHVEAIGHDLFAELRIYLAFLFGFSWQVKKYKYPHDTVCVKSFKHLYHRCYNTYINRVQVLKRILFIHLFQYSFICKYCCLSWRNPFYNTKELLIIPGIISFLFFLQSILPMMLSFVALHSSAGFFVHQYVHPLSVIPAMLFS